MRHQLLVGHQLFLVIFVVWMITGVIKIFENDVILVVGGIFVVGDDIC